MDDRNMHADTRLNQLWAEYADVFGSPTMSKAALQAFARDRQATHAVTAYRYENERICESYDC